VAEYLGVSQKRCDVDIVPLGVGGGDIQFGDVVEILLNAEVRDRLIRRHRTRIVAVPNEYDFLSWFISRT